MHFHNYFLEFIKMCATVFAQTQCPSGLQSQLPTAGVRSLQITSDTKRNRPNQYIEPGRNNFDPSDYDTR